MATITKRGPRRYQARIRRKGYPTLTATFNSRADAQRWVREQEHQIDLGTQPGTLMAQRTTLADAFADYLKKVTPKHKGKNQETDRILAMSEHPMASLPLAELTFVDIEDYIDDRMHPDEGDGVAGSTVNRELGILVQVLKRARKHKWMVHDPMADVDRPKNPPGRERRLEPDERKRFRTSLKETRNKLFKGFIIMASETGMRRGELLRIGWSQVNFQRRVICLRGPQTKNGKGREVPLTRTAATILRWLRTKTGKQRLVFGKLTPEAIKKCWQRLCKRANVVDFRLHDLRHERVSSLVDAGWSVINAMAVSGHKDMAAFRRYAHPNIDKLVTALDALDSR